MRREMLFLADVFTAKTIPPIFFRVFAPTKRPMIAPIKQNPSLKNHNSLQDFHQVSKELSPAAHSGNPDKGKSFL